MGTSYRIQSGDTLGALAKRFNTTVSALAEQNGIPDPNLIYAGQVLEVADGFDEAPPAPVELLPEAPAAVEEAQPPPAAAVEQSYTVRSGDTLSGIAARFGTTLGALTSTNRIPNPNLIYPGQRLTIPVEGAAPAAPVEPPANVAGVSVGQLQAIMPGLGQETAQYYLPYLNAAMAEAEINTPRRQAAFLAQLAAESGQFRWMEELASGAEYEWRADLGNTQPGDGVRFKGRGPIQLTGRSNYAAASEAIGVDLVSNPARAADPDIGFRTAAWFWNSRNLSSYADSRDFDAITYRVNGGYNGKAARDAYYQRALAVLGA